MTDRAFTLNRRLQRAALVAVFLVGLAVAGFALGGEAGVSLTSTGPNPGRVTVTWGDTVSFVNNDGGSVVLTSARPEFSGATLGPGQSHQITFEGRAGGYPYREVIGKHSFTGSVILSVAGAVTLRGTAKELFYGKSLRLSGKSTLVGRDVTIQQHLAGQPGWVNATTLPTGADGSFTMTIAPTIGVKYRATAAASQIFSPSIEVAVLPVVAAGPRARQVPVGKNIVVVARIRPPGSATSALLMRLNRNGNWTQVGKAKLSASGVAVLKWPVKKGRSVLRVELKHPTILAGYTPSFSRTFTVIGG